jgi:DNA-binding NtrC family response regulator
VGAQAGCDLQLSDRQVSGHHFEILFERGGYCLRDLDSTNGTYVSGHRVKEVYLNPGTTIYLGETRLRFEPLEESAAIELSASDRFGEMVGTSPVMRALFAQLERVAPTDASVLVTGETGTGKELIAEAIHSQSPRASGPFVVVDCGSIPTNLIGSELFGHEKGAFTGATSAHAGAFEQASGGTVFLDELGELPLEQQVALLGVLERRSVRRIGGRRAIPVDIRVVAATNRDLAKEMNRGTFRSDLYYRLAVLRVHLPPLRERREDIPFLAQHFLSLLPGEHRVSNKLLENLSKQPFPGNVRELRNLIERSVILADSGLHSEELDNPSESPEPSDPDVVHFQVNEEVAYRAAKSQLMLELERRYLRRLLDRHDGNISKAARAAGLDRMTVHKMLQRTGLAERYGRKPS